MSTPVSLLAPMAGAERKTVPGVQLQFDFEDETIERLGMPEFHRHTGPGTVAGA